MAVHPKSAAELLWDARHTRKLSTGCALLDATLDGGISAHGITEIAGAAGVGKTQLVLQLMLQAHPTPPHPTPPHPALHPTPPHPTPHSTPPHPTPPHAPGDAASLPRWSRRRFGAAAHGGLLHILHAQAPLPARDRLRLYPREPRSDRRAVPRSRTKKNVWRMAHFSHMSDPVFATSHDLLENDPFLPYVGPRFCHISRFNSPGEWPISPTGRTPLLPHLTIQFPRRSR